MWITNQIFCVDGELGSEIFFFFNLQSNILINMSLNLTVPFHGLSTFLEYRASYIYVRS